MHFNRDVITLSDQNNYYKLCDCAFHLVYMHINRATSVLKHIFRRFGELVVVAVVGGFSIAKRNDQQRYIQQRK